MNILNKILDIYTQLLNEHDKSTATEYLNSLARAHVQLEAIQGIETLSDRIGQLAAFDDDEFEQSLEYHELSEELEHVIYIIQNIKKDVEASDVEIDVIARIYADTAHLYA